MKYLLILLLIIGSFTVAADLTDELKGTKEVYRSTYTPYESTLYYYDNTVNKVYFSTITFTDSKGTLLKDAYSLMNCEFCSEIRLAIEADKDFPIKVIDFNLTSIKIIPQLTDKNLDINIPLKVNNLQSKTVNQSLLVTGNKVGDTAEVKLPFGFDKEIKYGFNSTTIKINDTETGSVADVYMDDGIQNMTSQIKFNISSIPKKATILNVTLTMYISLRANVNNHVTIFGLSNQSWDENSPATVFNNQTKRNITYQNSTNLTGTYTTFNVYNVTVTDFNEGNDFTSFRFEVGDYTVKNPIVNIYDYPPGGLDAGQVPSKVVIWQDRENFNGDNIFNYINITYSYWVNSTLGVFNNTYYNYTDGVIYSNSSAGNGSYTSSVFALNGAYNQLNITASTESQAGYQVQGSVRTKNATIPSDWITYIDFDSGTNDSNGFLADKLGVIKFATDSEQCIPLKSGLFGNALDFDGVNDGYLKSTSVIPTQYQNLTINAWINTEGDTNLVIFSGGGTMFQFNNNQLLFWQNTCCGAASSGTFSYNNVNWAMVTVTHQYDNNDTRFYINGTLIGGSTNSTTKNDAGNTVFTIGSWQNDNREFIGFIDEFRFYNRLLSEYEIQLLYNESNWTSWPPYQFFSSGLDTKNYSIQNTSTFAQAKFLMFDNSTYQTKLYGFNWTGWNFYGEAEEPTGVCACGTPASCIAQWTWNMSCNCNITTPYLCPSTYLNIDTSIGIWWVNTTVTARFDFANGSSTQKILGNASGWLNTS